MTDLEVGLALPNVGDGASLERCRHVAQRAVASGLRSLWMTDHLVVGPDAAGSYGQVVEPLTGLAVLAGELDGVSFGTSIVLLPLRNPVLVAKQATVLQEATGGRFRLGIGIGWHEAEYDMLHIDFDERGERADEALALIRALWSGEQEFLGQRWSLRDAAFGPVPDVPPQIWIGGNSPPAQRRARHYGDAWHPFLPDPDDVAAFRDGSELPVRPRMLISFDDGADGGTAFSGTAAQVTEHLHELRDAGADGFVISLDPPPHDDPRGLEILADEVLPSLASADRRTRA